MNYEKKYLKYKQKYLALKNLQEGGGLSKEEKEEKERKKKLETELRTKISQIPGLKPEDIKILKEASLKYLQIVNKLLEDNEKGKLGEKKVSQSELYNEISNLPKLIQKITKNRRRDIKNVYKELDPRILNGFANVILNVDEEYKLYKKYILINRQVNYINFPPDIIEYLFDSLSNFSTLATVINWFYDDAIFNKAHLILARITNYEDISKIIKKLYDKYYTSNRDTSLVFKKITYFINHLESFADITPNYDRNIFIVDYYLYFISLLAEKNVYDYDRRLLTNALDQILNNQNLDLKQLASTVKLSEEKQDELSRTRKECKSYRLGKNSSGVHCVNVVDPPSKEKLMPDVQVKLATFDLSLEERNKILAEAEKLDANELFYFRNMIGLVKAKPQDYIYIIKKFNALIKYVPLSPDEKNNMSQKEREKSALFTYISGVFKTQKYKTSPDFFEYLIQRSYQTTEALITENKGEPEFYINEILDWFIADNIFIVFDLLNNISEEQWLKIFETVTSDSDYSKQISTYNLGTLFRALDEIVKANPSFTGDKINIPQLKVLFDIVGTTINQYDREEYKNLIKKHILENMSSEQIKAELLSLQN
jgi:hypothetical protein